MTFAYRQIGLRLKAHWRFKLVAILAFMAAFFAGYFLLLKFPVFPAREMPLTAFDRWIAFQPLALLPYVSLWIYVPLAPGLSDDRGELAAYYRAAILLCLAGMAVFFFWPTRIPRLGIDWSRHPSFSLLRSVDGSGNACPSLHAAFAVFSALWIAGVLRQMNAPGWLRLLNAGWCAAILYSTVATRQHVAIDLFAGTALGLAGSALPLGKRWIWPLRKLGKWRAGG